MQKNVVWLFFLALIQFVSRDGHLPAVLMTTCFLHPFITRVGGGLGFDKTI
jgi:hypothetical protein